MAVLLYTNGLTEDYKPKKLTFSEQEILDIFSEYDKVKSLRVIPVINTWCVYAESGDMDNTNQIATVIMQKNINTNVLFIHDSEIDPDWGISDNILYKGYDDFEDEMKNLIEVVATEILNEIVSSEEYSERLNNLPYFISLGTTPDKKLLYGYNPDDQAENFYNNEEFDRFSEKIYEYISKNKQTKEPFTIYEDNKAIILLEEGKSKKFLNTLLENFKGKEEYEICTNISKIMTEWTKTIRTNNKIKSSGDKTNDKE